MVRYHMNKKECEITDQVVILEILRQGKFAVLSLCRSNEPYVVTLNYGFDKERNALYFHTAAKGLKIDFIGENSHACGTVIQDRGYRLGQCSHAYRSVVFWGTLSVVEEMEEKKYGMDVLLHHLEEDPGAVRERLLKDDLVYEQRDLAILRLDIEEITGKQGD